MVGSGPSGGRAPRWIKDQVQITGNQSGNRVEIKLHKISARCHQKRSLKSGCRAIRT